MNIAIRLCRSPSRQQRRRERIAIECRGATILPLADDARGAQCLDLGARVTDLQQDLISVLPKPRSPEPDASGCALKARGRPCLTQAARDRMIYLDERAASNDLRMFQHLTARERGRAGHIVFLETLHPLRRGACTQYLLCHDQSIVNVSISSRRGAKTRILKPFRMIECVGESPPLPISHDRNRHEAVLGLVDEID